MPATTSTVARPAAVGGSRPRAGTATRRRTRTPAPTRVQANQQPVLYTAEMLAGAFAEATPAKAEEPIASEATAEQAEVSPALRAALDDALEAAKQCTTDCGIAWDEVEELSAATAKAKASKTGSGSPVRTLQQDDLDRLAATAASLKAAQSMARPGVENIDMYRAIELAATAAGSMSKKAAEVDPRVDDLRKLAEAALAEARQCGAGEDCAASWDTVDELYDAVNKLSGKPDTPMGTLKM